MGIDEDNELTVPIQDTTDNSISSSTTNKRQSDSNDNDDSDQPRIIKTIPGYPRTTQGMQNESGLNIQNILQALK